MCIVLERFCYAPKCTFGRLKFNTGFCYTVEKPWLDNRASQSCIPEGRYRIGRVHSPKFKQEMYTVLDVPDRTHILFHKGNTAKDVAGCIAVGFDIGVIDGIWAVTQSKIAYDKLVAWLDTVDHPSINITHDTRSGIL